MRLEDWHLLVSVAEGAGIDWTRVPHGCEPVPVPGRREHYEQEHPLVVAVWHRLLGSDRWPPREYTGGWPTWADDQDLGRELWDKGIRDRVARVQVIRGARTYLFGTKAATAIVALSRLVPGHLELDAATTVLLASGEVIVREAPKKPVTKASRR